MISPEGPIVMVNVEKYTEVAEIWEVKEITGLNFLIKLSRSFSGIDVILICNVYKRLENVLYKFP